MNDKVYRSIRELRADGKTISGIAVVTESWSKDLGGFREIIRKGALTEDLIARSDVMLNMDHDPSKVLARSKFGSGSLRLFITERGLEFQTECPDTQLGHDCMELLRRGDYSQCSFCFTIGTDGENWYRNESGELCREITSFDRLYDVSIVYDPAYDDTSVDARSGRMVSIFRKLNTLEKMINNITV